VIAATFTCERICLPRQRASRWTGINRLMLAIGGLRSSRGGRGGVRNDAFTSCSPSRSWYCARELETSARFQNLNQVFRGQPGAGRPKVYWVARRPTSGELLLRAKNAQMIRRRSRDRFVVA